ncbi:MAG: hypothetical protein JWP91_1426 [Fibrobacteres bacterium]|nr:hypothetical protein [Fibrobacterota bacterium]
MDPVRAFPILICGLLSLCHPARGQKNLDIFLLIGQSNMSGRGPMIASDSTTDIAGAWLFKDSATWERARNPLNRYSTLEAGSPANQVGPGFGFSQEMHRLLPAAEFGLVVNARGGSSIVSWAKGTAYYADALKRSRQAMKSGTLKGILWHQGESDAADSLYLDKLVALMESLRKDLGIAALPVIAGQIGQFEPKHAAFNARILTLPQRLAHCAVVESDGLVDKGDKLHFDRKSQIILGGRYAAKAWALVYDRGPVGLDRGDGIPVRGGQARGRAPARSIRSVVFPAAAGEPGAGMADALGRQSPLVPDF